MAQTVILSLKAVAEPRRCHLRALMDVDRPRDLFARSEPELKIVRDRNQPALPSLGFAGIHRDEAPIQINLAPVKALQFGCPQARKGSQGKERRQGLVGFRQQGSEIFRREDGDSGFGFLYRTIAGKGLPPLTR